MRKLRENVDLMAIMVIALILGAGEAPKIPTQIFQVVMEHSTAEAQLLRVSAPFQPTVSFR